MNITLSADEELVRTARRYAQEHGTSLNQLVRDYLAQLVGELPRDEAARNFTEVARAMAGDSGGVPWRGREELYKERLETSAALSEVDESGGLPETGSNQDEGDG
jgi:hypothetical protein